MEIFIVIVAGFGIFMGFVIGFFAKRKNRNGRSWGIPFGFAVAAGLWLMFCELSSSSKYRKPDDSLILISFLIFLSGFVGMIIMAFLKPLCPKCRQSLSIKQWKEKQCPHCGKGEEESK